MQTKLRPAAVGSHDASGPGEPLGPGLPDGPGAPEGPVVPCGPVVPAGPAVPSGPTVPCGPVVPAGPVVPGGPEGPVVPGGPLAPAGPGEPDGPTIPEGRTHGEALALTLITDAAVGEAVGATTMQLPPTTLAWPGAAGVTQTIVVLIISPFGPYPANWQDGGAGVCVACARATYANLLPGTIIAAHDARIIVTTKATARRCRISSVAQRLHHVPNGGLAQ